MNRQWILLLTVFLVTALFSFTKSLDAKKKCVVITTSIMTLFSGLRTWWMGDLIKYYSQYRACNSVTWKETVFEKVENIGLRLFFRAAGALGISYDVCIFLIAAFSAITLGIVIYRYSTSPCLGYLMYISMGFYIFTYSGLKQTVAMGFLCLAFIGIMEGSWIKFLFWTLIGGMFHAPALIFLLAYPFSRKRVDRLYFLFLIGIFAVVFFFRSQLASELTELYYDTEDTLETTTRIGGRAVMMAFILIVSVFLRPLRSEDKQYSYVYNLMVIAALLQLFAVFSNNYTRLADYYYQFVVVFIPMFLAPEGVLPGGTEKPEQDQAIGGDMLRNLIILGVIVFAFWFYSQQIGPGSFTSEYKFFWEVDAHALYGT